MSEISAKVVNEFRKVTGLGLMKCKELLAQAGGDMEKALTLAKEQGVKDAGKRAGRATSMGRLEFASTQDGRAGALVEVNCETDFVARNDEFKAFAQDLAAHVLAHAPTGATDEERVAALMSQPFRDGRTVAEEVTAVNARTGENVSVSRVCRFAVATGGRVECYIHHDFKSGALVQLDVDQVEAGSHEEVQHFAKDLALHITACAPIAVSRDQIPPEVIAEQKRIFMAQLADKPEAMREKIAEGKLQAWYAEGVLLDQDFIKDMDKEKKRKVREALADLSKTIGANVTIGGFVRYVVGESQKPAPATE
ncbi:translation elongation factor Ts [Isosphaera pallida ATCC 43644]|uniref:Elongation factor Ts n=1 Tax=Isosphaera pallida (strain ATCC 43644 / DSM 9630 / IS1B) TaxID=575540 RepID=E8QZP3_ISOPI|nr:translation elongation factor Ts [Isosphaera pallida]ADV62179.1 translation elongation factor Ts [Isosphaera pallida ATCC 43644]